MVQKPTSRRMEIRKRKDNRNEFDASTAAATTAGHPQKRYMGVRRSPSGRWVAEIKGTAQRIRLWLGTFDTAEEAAHAYDEAACLLRGANTRTNFWPRSSSLAGKPGATSSILPAKVFNHLLRHIETRRAADPQPPTPPPPPPSMRLPQPQQPLDNQSEVDKGVEFEGMSIGSEDELSCFYAPLETYEYWLMQMQSSAAKNV